MKWLTRFVQSCEKTASIQTMSAHQKEQQTKGKALKRSLTDGWMRNVRKTSKRLTPSV